jgi:hypothetical protein
MHSIVLHTEQTRVTRQWICISRDRLTVKFLRRIWYVHASSSETLPSDLCSYVPHACILLSFSSMQNPSELLIFIHFVCKIVSFTVFDVSQQYSQRLLLNPVLNRHWSVPWARWIHSTPSNHISLIIPPPTHPRTRLPRVRFSSGFLIKSFRAYLICLMHAAFPAHPILDLNTVIIFGDD